MAENVKVPPLTEAPETVVGGTPTSVFGFDFPFWSAADIIVRIDGVVLDPADYTVEGLFVQNGDPVEGGFGSGVLTLNEAVTGVTVTIDRFVVGSRETVFSKTAPLPMPALNSDINKVVARQQDLERRQAAVLAVLPLIETLPEDIASESYVDAQVSDRATTDLANVDAPAGRIALGVPSSAALAAASGATLINTIRTETGSIVRTVRDVLRDRVSVKDFGAVGDGISRPLSSVTSRNGVDTTGWNLFQWLAIYPFADSLSNELDWCAHQAAANTGKLVDVPGGRYILGSKTVVGTNIFGTNDGTVFQGAGIGETFWIVSGTTGDCFNFTTLTCAGIHDGTLVTTQTRTSGAAIRFRDSNDVRSRNIRFRFEGSARWFANYIIDGGDNQYICRISGYQLGYAQYGMLVGTTTAGVLGGLVQGLVIGEGVGDQCSEAGIELRNASGIQFSGWADFIKCKHSIKTNPGVGQIVTGLLISGFLCDTSELYGCYLTTNGGSVSNVSLNGMWSASSGTLGGVLNSPLCSGLFIDQGTGKIDGVSVVGGEYYNNISTGIAVISATNVHITGAQVGYNSIGTAGLFPGIYFGPGATDCSVTGGMSGPYGLFKARDNKPSGQSYGVHLDGCQRVTVIGCNVTDNVTSGILNTGAACVVDACPGYRTKASQAGAITAGNTFVDIPLSFEAPLDKGRVTVEVFGNANLWADSVTGQTVRVTASGPVAATTFFTVNVDQSF